ncbi:hypothetical protein KI387_020704, partial [Taxus chinensis]
THVDYDFPTNDLKTTIYIEMGKNQVTEDDVEPKFVLLSLDAPPSKKCLDKVQ